MLFSEQESTEACPKRWAPESGGWSLRRLPKLLGKARSSKSQVTVVETLWWEHVGPCSSGTILKHCCCGPQSHCFLEVPALVLSIQWGALDTSCIIQHMRSILIIFGTDFFDWTKSSLNVTLSWIKGKTSLTVMQKCTASNCTPIACPAIYLARK